MFLLLQHPDFRPGTDLNNIAVLKLVRNARTTTRTAPVTCGADVNLDSICYLVGYGETSTCFN